jgi:hypothetical protein
VARWFAVQSGGSSVATTSAIVAQISGVPFNLSGDPLRVCVYDAPLDVQRKGKFQPRHVFVFSDVLLWCKASPVSASTLLHFKGSESLKLPGATLDDVADNGAQLLLRLTTRAGHSHTFRAPSAAAAFRFAFHVAARLRVYSLALEPAAAVAAAVAGAAGGASGGGGGAPASPRALSIAAAAAPSGLAMEHVERICVRLLLSEREYVRDLDTLLKRFFIGMLSSKVADGVKLSPLFGPIDDVVSVAVAVLAQLGAVDDVIANARTFSAAKSLLLGIVGEPLPVYARYINTLRRRLRRLERLAQREPAVGAFVVANADAGSVPAFVTESAYRSAAGTSGSPSASTVVSPRANTLSPRTAAAAAAAADDADDETKEVDSLTLAQIAPLCDLLRRPAERLCAYAYVCRQLSDSGGFGTDLKAACEVLENATSTLASDPTLLTGPPPFALQAAHKAAAVSAASAAAAAATGAALDAGGEAAATTQSGTLRRLGSVLSRAKASAVQHAQTLRTKRSHRLFGVELDVIAADGLLPEPIEVALTMLRSGSVTPQDLLSPKAPTSDFKLDAETSYSTGRPFDTDESTAVELIKLFLQQLPQPLFPTSLYGELMALVPKARANAPDLCADLSLVISRLSSTRITFLRRLCATLIAIATRHAPPPTPAKKTPAAAGSTSSTGSEGLSSVAMVFGPLLMRSGKRSDKSSFEARFTEAGDSMAVTLAILAHADELIGKGRASALDKRNVAKLDLDNSVDLTTVSRGGGDRGSERSSERLSAVREPSDDGGSSGREDTPPSASRFGTPHSPRMRDVVDRLAAGSHYSDADIEKQLGDMTKQSDDVVGMLRLDSEFERMSALIIEDESLRRMSLQVPPENLHTSLMNLDAAIRCDSPQVTTAAAAAAAAVDDDDNNDDDDDDDQDGDDADDNDNTVAADEDSRNVDKIVEEDMDDSDDDEEIVEDLPVAPERNVSAAQPTPPIPNVPPPALRRKKTVDDSQSPQSPQSPTSPRSPKFGSSSPMRVPIEPTILDWQRAKPKPLPRVEKCKLLGAPLNDRLRFERQTNPDAAVPAVVQQCSDYLRADNRLRTDGLFRVSATATMVSAVVERLEAGDDVDFAAIGDVHIVSNVLKRYFMALPDELLPFALVGPIAKDAETGDANDVAQRFRGVVAKLPSAVAALLRALMWLLRDVADHATVNRMTTNNIGVVFGPSIYRSVAPGADDLANARLMSVALTFVLDHIDVVFGSRPAGAERVAHATSAAPSDAGSMEALLQSCMRQIEFQSIVLTRAQSRIDDLEQAVKKLDADNLQLKFLVSSMEGRKKKKK